MLVSRTSLGFAFGNDVTSMRAAGYMRRLWVVIHRWVGLSIAGFLFVSGLTGAVISWDHELDDLVNPHLTEVDSQGEFLNPLELAGRLERGDPRVRVTYIPLAPESGKALTFGVSPRVDPATGTLFEPGYNEVFVDPVTGTILGQRDWGAAWPITRETLVSFLYVLHYSLHIPQMWGIDLWGMWLFCRRLSDAASTAIRFRRTSLGGSAPACPRVVGALGTGLENQALRQLLPD